MKERPSLAELGLSTGKKARLHRILFQHGLRNGTALFLPYDQGLEHGPRDFFANQAASDPGYIVRLALEGGFNGIALQIGLAEKFYWDYAGEVPLILKLNGKTDIPSDASALSPLHASVADAVRLGADAVGYTMYVGTPAAEADFAQYRAIREDAHRLGLPLVVWAYPRGSAIEAKGGKDSFYAVDYAARTASELGADVVKVNFPHPEKQAGVKEEYGVTSPPSRRSTRWCARPAGPWCWSRVVSGPGTTRWWRRHGSPLRPARPGSSSAATSGSGDTTSRSASSPGSGRSWRNTPAAGATNELARWALIRAGRAGRYPAPPTVMARAWSTSRRI